VRSGRLTDADRAVAQVAASTFRLDIKGAQVRSALRAAGIRSVLLKGRAFAQLLYADSNPRNYFDLDLLVDPQQRPMTEEVLRSLGFERLEAESPSSETDPAIGKTIEALGSVHGATWVREHDGMAVDLHHSLPQVAVEPSVVWEELSHHLATLNVAGVPTDVLNPAASALLVALHAAHHGPGWGSGLRDLERATRVLDLECWTAAREIAVSLGVDPVMGVGLGLIADGRKLARELGLATAPSPALRLLWTGAPWSAGFLESLIGAPGNRRRAALIAEALWPTPAAMRRGSALARRGRWGLLTAYGIRTTRLLWRVPRSMRSWQRARRSTGAPYAEDEDRSMPR
jgi:hypothetical protein